MESLHILENALHKPAAVRKREYKWKKVRQNYILYLFLLPAVVYILIFHYIPIYGIQIAFKDFEATQGILGSPWVGWIHFRRFFESYQCFDLIRNTLVLSVYSLIAGFPMPIILALILNYSTMNRLKKFTQTVTYAPHFISTVVMVGMILVVFSPTGMVNQFIKLAGGSSKEFIGNPAVFRHLYVWSSVWKNTGWSCIIYIATLAGVNPELHEAAIVDGANKINRIWHIDIPSILPTTIILLILQLGSLMSIGFEKAYLMQNSVNLSVSEIISTYVYKMGIQGAQYSYSTAIGLLNNVINFLLLITVNKIASKVSDSSLW
jgi:putative aldouronate transport system permease protein